MKNQKIGNFIANLRKEKNLTQKDLADKLGITDRAVSKWERGICLPDIILFEDISQIFNISVSELLKGEKIKKKEVLEEKEIINAFTNIELNIKNKYKNISNIVIITFFIIITILISYNVFKPIYYTNKIYKAEVDSTKYLITNVENKINIIRNNQGKYTSEEYRSILSFINNIDINQNIKEDNELYQKDAYTFNEIYKRINTKYNNNILYFALYNIKDIYELLKKYDVEVENNYPMIERDIEYYEEQENKLKHSLSSIYYINQIPDKYMGRYFKLTIWYRYKAYYLTLKDIIEVGEIYE